jgi:histidinol-phosphate/aromatic aminotransferase/cobyric acid decarboxylase-like protein
MIFLNTPNNPTGQLISIEDLETNQQSGGETRSC